MKMINNIIRFGRAPTNIAEIKANIFSFHTKQKTEFKDGEVVIFENEAFKVELKGYKLNQIHRDILDIVLYFGDKEFDGKLKDNSFVRTISLYKIKEFLGYTSSNNIKWIENKLDEMQQTLIEVLDKEDELQRKWKFQIISTAQHSKKLNSYAVVIHPLYYEFFKENISMDYSYYLHKILNLRNGVTKAAVRFLLTHKEKININIDNLLKKIGVGGSQRNLEIQRAKLLEELQNIKTDFNIELKKMSNDNRKKNDYNICYKRLKEIKFYYPQQIPN